MQKNISVGKKLHKDNKVSSMRLVQHGGLGDGGQGEGGLGANDWDDKTRKHGEEGGRKLSKELSKKNIQSQTPKHQCCI